MLILSFVDPDPLYGPAVRCKKISSIWVMRSCINVSGLWLELILIRRATKGLSSSTLQRIRVLALMGISTAERHKGAKDAHYSRARPIDPVVSDARPRR